eukprot:CAMPEP_0197829064 /NCGR_PEP_ID=MMETSP1437-20131217/5534_1 /TAXON_ID=49252 ORGANISM="Eucampia antarctica, Strain CCMP1452" /NCGR_SAMPLE_ID=MMETSP1437 /ASSEMBLY_ACC=CAM_ASM_001096 /LENGTH=422 /DNA_ID=CAMNT_0043430541 /DNA_START=65 /DNA_END=1333 /DNA_ORIENTATION=-
MRQAESSLMLFARRFAPLQQLDDSDFTVELLDTPIPRSAIPLNDKTARCQFMESNDDNDSLIIHSIKVTSNEQDQDKTKEEARPPLILLHGYANGALYFYRNLLGLASSRVSSAVYALDMLGWGLSSRPRFELTDDDSVETAENFFVESLEAWRKYHNIPKMILGGHSMGGYLSVAYAEKYPANVERLILLSPVGVPDHEPDPEVREKLSLKFRFMLGLAESLWNYGTTPSSFVRSLPESVGRPLVAGYIERRLPAITDLEERNALTDYLYTNAILPGSGEYCLNRILSPMAFAKKPLVYRIPDLKVKKISFVYGQNDWMDSSGGLEVQKLCEEKQAKGEEAPIVEVLGVRYAGHLLMLENSEEFNSAVVLSAGGSLHCDAPKPLFFHHQEQHREFFLPNRFARKTQEKDNFEKTTTSPGLE